MPAANPIKTCAGCSDLAARAAMPVAERCSPCRKKERHRLWCLINPGANAANASRWRAAGNKTARPEDYDEKQRIRNRERYHNDPEYRQRTKDHAARQRARQDKADRNAASKAWRQANPEKFKQARLRREAAKPEDVRKAEGKAHRHKYREQRQAGAAAYYARRHGGTGEISNEHLTMLHKWQDHCCFYCREHLNEKETIEHVVPLSRGGSNNPWNVVLACGDCNSKKNNRIFEIEWQPEHIASVPRFHSLYGTHQLAKKLADVGVVFTKNEDHLAVSDRPIFMLSSFWLGWQGDRYIKSLKEKYPTALLFFDKEFVRRPDAILNVLKAKAGLAQRIGARELRLETPTAQEAAIFINRWHAMGNTSGLIYSGLRDDSDWWIIAAFRKEVGHYEVVRMACRESVAGGVSRIMNHFRKNMPEKLPIVAFTDQRMGDGKSHFFSGFEEAGLTERSFFYATPEADGFHPRRMFQKQVLEQKAEYYDPDKTQMVLAKANGLMRAEGLSRLKFVLNP